MLDEYCDSCGQLLKLVRRPVLQAARVSGGSLVGAAQGLCGLPNPQPGDLQRGQSLLETCGPLDPPGVTLVASLSSVIEGLGQPAWPLTAGPLLGSLPPCSPHSWRPPGCRKMCCCHLVGKKMPTGVGGPCGSWDHSGGGRKPQPLASSRKPAPPGL